MQLLGQSPEVANFWPSQQSSEINNQISHQFTEKSLSENVPVPKLNGNEDSSYSQYFSSSRLGEIKRQSTLMIVRLVRTEPTFRCHDKNASYLLPVLLLFRLQNRQVLYDWLWYDINWIICSLSNELSSMEWVGNKGTGYGWQWLWRIYSNGDNAVW